MEDPKSSQGQRTDFDTLGQNTQTDKPLENVLAFLKMTMSAHEEQEIARLVATGLPGLLQCGLSGLALRQEMDGTWYVVLQQAGQLAVYPEAEAFSTRLEQLLPLTIAQGQLQYCDQAQQPQARAL